MIAQHGQIPSSPARAYQPEDLLTIREVAMIVRPLGRKPVSAQAVYRWIREGVCGKRRHHKPKLRAIRLPTETVVRYQDLIHFLEQLQPDYEEPLTEDQGLALMRAKRMDARVQGGGVAITAAE